MCENENSTIHVTLAVHDPKGTYAQHAGVVMTSMFENTQSPVCVHILHDKTLTEENRERFLLTAERYAQSVLFWDMSEYVEKLAPEVLALVDNTFSAGTLYRLFVPEVLPLNKVIYLDSDIVVNLDIKELWKISLDDHCLAGVLEPFLKNLKRSFSVEGTQCRLNGCDPSSYINAGVLVMNLDLVRKHCDMVRECIHWLNRHRHTAVLPDQDFLNAFFRGRIKLIDTRFNCNPCGGDISNTILHAMGPIKPWKAYQGTAIEPLYWKTLLKTPWATAESCIDALYDCMGRTALLHRHTVECYRQIFTRLKKDLFNWPVSFFQTLKVLWLHFRSRTKQ